MQNIKKNKKSGFTLIELILSMGLLGIVVVACGSMIVFGIKLYDKSEAEYQFQFFTRMTLDKTSDVIRYSSAVFTIPESSFREDNLDEGWDYIGIHKLDDGDEIVKYTYDDATKIHIAQVLIPAKENVAYKFLFKKVNPHTDDSLLQFSIVSYQAESTEPMLTIQSEVEARNTMQVIDFGTTFDPAVAIAFSSEERGVNIKRSVVNANIAMVLDTSGSMADDLSGDPIGDAHGGAGESRISILKNEAKNLIDNFAVEENIDVALIPFSTSANNSSNSNYNFLKATTGTSTLYSQIDALRAIGGTNTGDGLRRAYHSLKAKQEADAAANIESSSYVIVLVDGVSTFASVTSSNHSIYLTANGNVNEGYLDRNDPFNPNGQIVGNGSSLDSKATDYVNRIGPMLSDDSFSNVYVIGFSSIDRELDSVDNIADACGITSENHDERVKIAGTSDELNVAFEAIRQDIISDLWYLQGPDLG